MRPCLDGAVQDILSRLVIIDFETLAELDAWAYGLSLSDISDGSVGLESEDGSTEIPFADYEAIACRNGGMGYASFVDGVPMIGIWFSPTATAAERALLLGHEIGHLIGIQEEDAEAEERRADTFGAVAATVVCRLAF